MMKEMSKMKSSIDGLEGGVGEDSILVMEIGNQSIWNDIGF